MRTTIETERERLPKGGRLTILRLNPAAPWEPVELASVCNPGTAAEADPIFVTRARVEKRWREAYADPIERAIAQATNGPPSPNSPIIVTIAATLLRPDFDARVAQRRLVIISDLLEHQNGGYSQLKGGDFRKAYRRGSSLVSITPLDLRGVTVALDYLVRGQYATVQGDKHREFWRWLLTEAGAADVSFIGMERPAVPQVESGDLVAKQSGRN